MRRAVTVYRAIAAFEFVIIVSVSAGFAITPQFELIRHRPTVVDQPAPGFLAPPPAAAPAPPSAPQMSAWRRAYIAEHGRPPAEPAAARTAPAPRTTPALPSGPVRAWRARYIARHGHEPPVKAY